MLNLPDSITIHFGMFKVDSQVIIHNDLPDETIGIPRNFSNRYTIPTDLPYEILYKTGEFHIGPVIGHAVAGKFSNLNNETLSAYLPRLAEYDVIKGLVFICTKDSIYPNKDFIKGYYYDPKESNGNNVWKKGRFPLPNSLFNCSSISRKQVKALQKKMGDTIFNSSWSNLDKWDLWLKLSKSNECVKYLPYTEEYRSIKDLESFLKKYSSVYLKPFCKSRGRGILNVFITEDKKEMIVIDDSMKRYCFKDYKTLDGFLAKKLMKPSIIQQAVPFRLDDKMIDFRIILQRDQNKEWSFKGSFAKISKKGSVITNSRCREKVIDGREALISIYDMSHKEAVNTEKEMIELTKKAIEIYERDGMHIGDVAADITIDANHHIWLLELQLNHAISEESIPPTIYKDMKTTPIRYAKALAGFI